MKVHAALEEPKRLATAPMRLLIVDDEETTRELCVAVAQQTGLKATAVASAEEALEVVDQSAIDIVLTDLKLPGTSGLELLKNLREMNPQIAVIVLTQYGSIDSAIEATRTGAIDYVTKPFRIEELRARLEHAMHEVDLLQENRVLREQISHGQPGFGKLIGLSPKMQRVYKTIEKVAGHEYPVLVLGESGTGKELVARSLHALGRRKEGPFVPVDCS